MYKINKTGKRVDELLDMVEDLDFVPMTEQDAEEMVHDIFGTGD